MILLILAFKTLIPTTCSYGFQQIKKPEDLYQRMIWILIFYSITFFQTFVTKELGQVLLFLSQQTMILTLFDLAPLNSYVLV